MKIIVVLLACCFWTGPSLLAAETSEGKDVFQKMCSRCHKLPETGKQTAKQWEIIMSVMQTITEKKGMVLLTETEKQQVQLYLQQNARQSAPDQETEAENIFIARCALCHQLPEPNMLKPKQWHLIVRTMQQRMQQASVPQLTDQESELILEYLAKQARK